MCFYFDNGLRKVKTKTGHECVKSFDVSIIYKNFNRNEQKPKIAKSFLIKQLRGTLNIHDKSVPLKLFN